MEVKEPFKYSVFVDFAGTCVTDAQRNYRRIVEESWKGYNPKFLSGVTSDEMHLDRPISLEDVDQIRKYGLRLKQLA